MIRGLDKRADKVKIIIGEIYFPMKVKDNVKVYHILFFNFCNHPFMIKMISRKMFKNSFNSTFKNVD